MHSEFDKIDDFLKDESFVAWVKNPTTELNTFWENWLIQNPDRRQDALNARQVIRSIAYKNKFEMDESELTDLFSSIKKSSGLSTDENIHPLRVVKTTSIRKTWWAWAAAIAFLVVAGSLSFYYTFWQPSTTEAMAMKEFKTQKGERKKITLLDGSVVTLNVNSTLRVPTEFAYDKREVELEGEAFFDITKNPLKPFIVKTPNFQTQVLGTSFNVRAYFNDENQNVAVVTGKVKMSHSEQVSQILTPNEVGVFDSKNKAITKESFEPKEVVAWKDGNLVFEKADFEEVFKRIEKWYGVTIEAEEGLILRGRYSGEFQNETLENVLTGIGFTSGFTYKMEKGKVLIQAK